MAIQNKMRPSFGQFAREQLNAHFPKDAHDILIGKKAATPATDSNAAMQVTEADLDAIAADFGLNK